jgi:homocitrate synthase
MSADERDGSGRRATGYGAREGAARPPYALVDTTLREGEQFESGDFTTEDKVEIARALAAFGVEYIELTSPAASPRARADCELIAGLGLRSRIVAHIRCHDEDARVAVASGVSGVSMVIGASPILRAASHGMAVQDIVQRAITVAEEIRRVSPSVELRFSTEDAFRCPPEELLAIFLPLNETGLFDRFGLADTIGRATPLQVYEVVKLIAERTGKPIEFHGHNDTGCAVANVCMALAAGATHLNVTVLGIGERNGIASLEGVIAALDAQDPVGTSAKYDLHRLHDLSGLVARKIGVEIPFNHCVVGRTAFTHKAGIHTKAVMNDPHTYEVLDPGDFGLERTMLTAHRLTGHNAIGARAKELGLTLGADEVRRITTMVKALADQRRVTANDVDDLLKAAAQRRATA